MPSVFFAKQGLSQQAAYGLHMLMYGTPTLLLIQEFLLDKLPKYFEKYIFNDWPFLGSLLVMVLLDTFSGGVAAWITTTVDETTGKKTRLFSARVLYKKMTIKLFGITMYVVAIGTLKNAVIDGEENILADIVDAGFYAVMLGFEAASVLRNTYKIYPFETLKWALSKLEVFYDKKSDKVE